MRFFLAASIALLTLAPCAFADEARPSAKMLQFPDVSAKDIVFVYANDLWLVPREGGMARPLASPPGRESFPKFSPDGKTIAFIGNYEGNRDVYTISLDGGTPSMRVTYHPASEVVTDWTPDGKVIYYAAGQGGLERMQQIYTADPRGGAPSRVPVPYGTSGTVSPDGAWLAYTPSTVDFRTWKRYRGGWAQDIWLFNLKDHSAKKVTEWEGNDTSPMWGPRGEVVHYLSDEGPEHRMNIWSYTVKGGERRQVTEFKDFDTRWPSIGPGPSGKGEIVFQNGDDLYLMDVGSGKARTVDVVIPGDRPRLREQMIDASKFIQASSLSPSGKRVVLQARGDIWTVPAVEGVARNLTRTSGIAERDPVWSPDGKRLAYFTDETGEYELYLADTDGKSSPRKLTDGGTAFRFMRSFSPDSKHILFTDKTGAVFLHSLGGKDADGSDSGTTKQIAKDQWSSQPQAAWSHDSGWIALVLEGDNTQNAIWLYEVASGELKQITGDMFNSAWPAFDRKGEWLYFISSRNFRPTYGDIDANWVYRDSDVILGVPLRKDIKNPLLPRSDEEDLKKDEDKKKEEGKDADKPAWAGRWECEAKESKPGAGDNIAVFLNLEKKDDGITGSADVMSENHPLSDVAFDKETKTLTFTLSADQVYTGSAVIDKGELKGTWTAADGRTGALEGKRIDDEAKKPLKIDLDGDWAIEMRAIALPIKPGTFRALAVNESGKIMYLRVSDAPRGPDDDDAGAGDIKVFDLHDDKATKKEEKTVVAGVDGFEVSADGKKALVHKRDDMYVIDTAPDQKLEKKVPAAGMTMMVNPREEWKQMYTELWRIFRDYFYVENMHGVDWTKQRDTYARLIGDAASRDDVSFIMAELISELNVGHAYYRPADSEPVTPVNVGLLGAEYELVMQDGITAYRIKRILRGGPWDTDARSPLISPGVDVKDGDFILAVNRAPIDVSRDIYAAFLGTANKPVSITVSERPIIDDKAREYLVKPVGDEGGIRIRAWIEANRRYIDEKSGGRIGYIYVVNTGAPGQNDLVRQFYGQRHKAALIIDDRWNGGGQIPTRFIELLNRPVTNYWARRDGKDWTWPPDSHQGPKVMLTNGLSASGGDMFPALFRQAGLGKLIGTRTWGGLVGISGNPGLIDGTAPSVPTFGFYERDGTWGIEGHGVDPDMVVLDDPSKMIGADGAIADPQIDAAIAHLEAEIQNHGYRPAQRPAAPDRSGMGLPESDR